MAAGRSRLGSGPAFGILDCSCAGHRGLWSRLSIRISYFAKPAPPVARFVLRMRGIDRSMADAFAPTVQTARFWTGAFPQAATIPVRSAPVSDEIDLVARARAGDAVAFERLFERYHAPVLNYLHRMVGDRALAEDLTQDSFVKAYRALPGTRPDLAFKAWLYRIATNTAISHLRRRKLIRWVPFLGTQDYASNESIERSVGRKHDVEQALHQLPDHYAAVLILRHYEGLSLAETASALGISENAAKLRLFRARKAFAGVYAGPVAE
jgi:RNA polymerase sigma-70 factor (ECF subfamily)